jgi:hypothetical protein
MSFVLTCTECGRSASFITPNPDGKEKQIDVYATDNGDHVEARCDCGHKRYLS